MNRMLIAGPRRGNLGACEIVNSARGGRARASSTMTVIERQPVVSVTRAARANMIVQSAAIILMTANRRR